MPNVWRLKEAESGNVLIANLEVATGFWKRFVGLQFRARLLREQGLLLAPTTGIHTFCMRFAIDVSFLDKTGTVLLIRPSVPPWRIVPPVRGACAVLETAAGTVTWEAGNRLCLEGPLNTLPKPLRNWTCD